MTAAPVLARNLKYSVTISRGEGAGKVISYEKPIVTIGRGPENDLVFANDPKISRTHAELRVRLGQLYIKNLSDRNFILVNGERVDQKFLTGSSEIQIGDTVLLVKVDTEPAKSNYLSLANPQGEKNSLAQAGFSQSIAKSNTSADFLAPPSPSLRSDDKYANKKSSSVRSSSHLSNNSRVRFYLIVAVVAGLFWWFLSDGNSSKKPEVNLRTEGDVARAIEDSANVVRELKKMQQSTGQDSIQYRASQEHYVKGFRDYRQGQYARAIQSFQAALSFYPSHELARKYLLQSQRKFDEMVNLSMSQGRKYYQKQNFKMCQSAFANVMIMVKDATKPKYKEAKQFYEECSIRTEGKF